MLKKISKSAIPTSMYRLGEALEQSGFQFVGSGASAKVYLKPQAPNVLKVFNRADTGYLSFLRFIAANPGNPHLPRLRGKLRTLSPDLLAVRLETLSSVLDGGPEFANLRTTLGKLNWLLKERNERPFSHATIRKKCDGHLPDSFIDTIIQLDHWRTHDFGGAWDIHSGNVMRRGETLVIIDPFYIDYGL